MSLAPVAERDVTFEGAQRSASHVRYRGISDDVARLLYTSAQRAPKDQAILEIGSFVGYSTIFLGFGSRAGCGAVVHCLDAWGLPPSSTYSKEAYEEKCGIRHETFDEFLQNVQRAGVTDLVVPHRAYSTRYSRLWPVDLKIGLLFIDGDHSEWGAYADWFLYRPYLADGARVVFHDFGDPAVTRAVRRIDAHLIGDGRIVGTGYQGREALAFSYRRDDRPDWRGSMHYAALSAWNAFEWTLLFKALRALKRAARRVLLRDAHHSQ